MLFNESFHEYEIDSVINDESEENIVDEEFSLQNTSTKMNTNLENIEEQEQYKGYAEKAKLSKVPLRSSSKLLQIEWTAHSETPIKLFRVQFMAADDPDWSEVNVESTNLEGDDWYGRTELVNLQPDSEYRVRVASENAEGSSQFSDVVNFFTTPAELVTKEAISSGVSSEKCQYFFILCSSSIISLLFMKILIE